MGVECVGRQVMATWKKVGVEKLGSVGETFNPQFHEAVSLVPSDEFKEDVVCGEIDAHEPLRAVTNAITVGWDRDFLLGRNKQLGWMEMEGVCAFTVGCALGKLIDS